MSHGGEVAPLTGLRRVAANWYRIKVTADGSSLSVDPAGPASGAMRSGFARFTATLAAGEGATTRQLTHNDGSIYVRTDTGSVDLPPGRYGLLAWRLEMQDSRGILWTASGDKQPWGARMATFEAGRPVRQLAVPLVAHLSVRREASGDFVFDMRLTTASGEAIRQIWCHGGAGVEPHSMARPRLKIIDAVAA